MNIAFVGLGTMGRHMAVNLLKAGYKLSVYNRDRRKTEGLGSSVHVVDSPGEAAQGADIVITMISDDRAVKEVYLGEGGIVPALQQQPGARTLIDCSTISPDTSLELAAHLSAIGVQMLDAPVTGSEPQAKEAQLTFIVGGDRELFESCLPLFNAMGKKRYIWERRVQVRKRSLPITLWLLLRWQDFPRVSHLFVKLALTPPYF